jgi:fumarate reductase subunit D
MPGELRLLVLTVIPTLYLALAMRRVYGGHWLPLILRTAAVESFYGVAVMTALLALFIVSFFY